MSLALRNGQLLSTKWLVNFTTEFLTNNKILLDVWETCGGHYDAIHNAVTTHQSLIKVTSINHLDWQHG